MNTPKALTESQAKLIHDLDPDLDPKTVTFKSAALPCPITIDIEGKPQKYWVFRDKASGKLKLGDEKPSFSKPQREGGPSDEEAEPQDLENIHGKWRQTTKQALSDIIAQSTYNPDELKAHLRREGFRELEAKAIVAQVCDAATIRQAAAIIAKSHGFVSAPRIQDKVKALREGKPLPSASGAIGLSRAVQKADEAAAEARRSFLREHPAGNVIVEPPQTLSDAMKHARESLANFPYARQVDIGDLVLASDELLSATASEAEKMVATIAVLPDILLFPEGRPALKTLVELVKTARYGPKTKAASARKTLAVLVSSRRGNRFPVPDNVLAHPLLVIGLALAPLKDAWHRFSRDPIATRLEGIRKLIGGEGNNFSDTELLQLLAGEDNLPTASARIAGKATGFSYKTFLRVWRNSPELQRTFPRPQ